MLYFSLGRPELPEKLAATITYHLQEFQRMSMKRVSNPYLSRLSLYSLADEVSAAASRDRARYDRPKDNKDSPEFIIQQPPLDLNISNTSRLIASIYQQQVQVFFFFFFSFFLLPFSFAPLSLLFFLFISLLSSFSFFFLSFYSYYSDIPSCILIPFPFPFGFYPPPPFSLSLFLFVSPLFFLSLGSLSFSFLFVHSSSFYSPIPFPFPSSSPPLFPSPLLSFF